jgi:hypothetical protein
MDPRPPAAQTAAASSGVQKASIGERMIGCSIFSKPVRRVFGHRFEGDARC